MLIRGASALVGENLTFVDSTDISVREGRFCEIRPTIREDSGVVDGSGLLIIPGLVNCHTHIGDSIAKDVSINTTTHGRVHPVFGAKAKILGSTSDEHLVQFMRATCTSMIRKGITTFVDFREGGAHGVRLLRKAAAGTGIRVIALGRIRSHQNDIRYDKGLGSTQQAELEDVLRCADGVGISGANENGDVTLRGYGGVSGLRAIHAAETEYSSRMSRTKMKRSEVERAMLMRPHFVVHMTHASPEDIKRVAAGTRGIVICPRANGALAGGVPGLTAMLGAGCPVALGTDNVMVNSPDVLREMDYIWKVSMGHDKNRISPIEILKMATVNASRILSRDVGVIRESAPADCILVEKHSLDLEPMHDPHAAVVHRVSESSIRAVMVGGDIVHGSL